MEKSAVWKQNEPEVLCIGSAVVDILAQPVGQAMEWKEKQRISSIQIGLGGDAANQSVCLANLGLNVELVTCVGDDANGKTLWRTLESRAVGTRYMSIKQGCATGTALVLVDAAGERHTFSVQGAHSTLAKTDLPPLLPKSCRAISLASLFSMPELEKDGLLEYLQDIRQKGIFVFADLASDKLKQGLAGIQVFLPYINYFLPSLYDALEMTGTATAEAAAAVYRELGVETVVIKCGKDGCFFADKQQSGWVPAIPVKPVDTTGAGDCMVALFISRILAGDAIKDACNYACAGASYSTLFLGASTEQLTEEKIKGWLQENHSIL